MTTRIAYKRIKKELIEVCESDEGSKWSIYFEPINDNFTQLSGMIYGPRDTPYEGGKYNLEILIPDTYPFNPPKIKF